MGYFSNGSEGESYFETYCAKCVHESETNDVGCPIWNLHLLHNYDDCNKKDSYLHVLIPRDVHGMNEQCAMFVPLSSA